eukprot:10502782-Lingulodinium_polyedra.AAC.1
MGALRGSVLRGPALELRHANIFAEAMAGGTLWYNAATWTGIRDADINNLDQAVVERARTLAKLPICSGWQTYQRSGSAVP